MWRSPGSSLSPTLFNVYMSPLAETVRPFGIKIITYANDTQLVVALNQPNASSPNLCGCLEEVANSMTRSCLKLNGEKSELVLLGHTPSFNANLLWPVSLGPPPHPKSTIKSLGIWLDHSLNFNHQAVVLSASCYGLLKTIT